MSVEMDFNTDKTIYVQLLDEGTFVLRPTKGEFIRGLIYELRPTEDYDPELETWEFLPGSIVECVFEKHNGEDILVAKHLSSEGRNP